ncbi:MAG: capsular polysaccharide synthesis protein [Muribaculaceae bacterium]|nr:capsular polysaccharide synthesis protein [Muribaculaceae bacterium]
MSRINRFLGRVWQYGGLIVKGHLLNPVWNDRDVRRRQRYRATLETMMGYLKRYAPEVSKITPAPVDNPGAEPEHAFTIWYQGEDNAPDLVKACFRSMRKNLKQKLIVLDENTLFDWISLPDFIIDKWKKGIIPHTQFSDICRVELLYQHGGLWFDATDYITAPVPQFIMDEDVFLYGAGEKIRGAYAFIQSCFIRGKKGNPLLGIWREANFIYWKEEMSKIDYFVHHLMLRLSTEVNPIAKECYARMPHIDQDPTHALWGEHADDVYDENLFSQLTRDAFFQKTNYKDSRLKQLKEGSVADYILNSNL